MDMSEFRITYDGPALDTSQMDVRELAPALVSIGDLLEAATKSLCGEGVRPQINVRGSFKTGSFGIDFTLVTSLANRMRELFSSSEATAIANALAILGALGFVRHKSRMGLFAVLKWLRGRLIEHVEVTPEMAILYAEGESLEIERHVLTLLRNVAVREAVSRVLSPLTREGITLFSAGTDDDIFEVVEASQVVWFQPPEQQDILLVDTVREMAVWIVSLAFKDDNKWRLSDGAATIHASISDAHFLKRVDDNEISFAKGDVLVCQIRVRQWQTQSGGRTDYDVIEVIEHRSAAHQIQLPGL
jgi:hypothetical protein